MVNTIEDDVGPSGLLTRNIRANKMFQASSMVKMKVAENDSLDVLDIVSASFDGVWKLMLLVVHNAREDICEWCTPFLWPSKQ